MGTDPWGFDLERQVLARELRSRRRWISRARSVVAFAFLLVLLLGGSAAVRTWARGTGWPGWASAALFLMALYAAGFLLTLPFGYLGLRLERHYGMTRQGLGPWLADGAKSAGLGLVSVMAAGLVLLWLIDALPVWWWLAAWALGLLVSTVLNFLAPVVIAPLFFRFRRLEDPALRARFEGLAAKAGLPVLGIFEMKASAKTRRSNAAVAGLGRTRRVIITDTMLAEFTPSEIESVLAHELGHERYGDPQRGLVVGAAISLAMLGVAAAAYAASYRILGFLALDDPAGLPLLAFYAALVSTALGPPELAWSRARESRADRFSLELTRDAGSFAAAMVKLTDQNLGVADPRPWEVWLSYSHPPGRDRVRLARASGPSG